MLAEINLGCSRRDFDHQYRIYVATYLGFGGNSVRRAYEVQLIIEANMAAHNSSDRSVCPPLLIKFPCA
jgi:hypothetical protein